MYITNKEIISILSNYYIDPDNKKNEREVVRVIKLMTEKNRYRREFIGYSHLHQDMISNAYYFYWTNLRKGNIKIKNTEIGQLALTTKECPELRTQNIVIKERIDNKFYVRRIEKTSKLGDKVKSFEYLDDILYEIKYEDIRFNNVFAYITSIITDSYWKIVNDYNHQKRTGQVIYNFEVRGSNWLNLGDTLEFDDFSSDYEKNKVYEMMKESIEYEKIVEERRKNKL